MTAVSRKLSIAHQGECIVGILETKTSWTQPQVILMSHDASGHKDAAFFQPLAQALPVHSFRFDFKGHGESQGTPGYANIEENVQEIAAVAAYFENQGYQVYGLIGYGRGAIACLNYASTCQVPIPHVINCAGPYQMGDPTLFNDKPMGSFDWLIYQQGGTKTIHVTQQELDRWTSWDNAHVKNMPLTTCVLTVHGIHDKIVPAYHAAMYANAIPNHTLALLPDADHSFDGDVDTVVQTIVKHLNRLEEDPYEKLMGMLLHTGAMIPRWIDVQGVRNFRDLGGWPIKSGTGYIRERAIFRCAHLGQITPQGIKVLQALNVKAVFDFRSDSEVKRYGGLPETPGIQFIHSPMSKTQDMSPTKLATTFQECSAGPEGFIPAYLDILDVGKTAFGNVFRHMVNSFTTDSKDALVVHCTGGKDRTGIWCMLLLELCGVEDQIIAREYALTNLGYWLSEDELQFCVDYTQMPAEKIKVACSAPYEAMMLCLAALKEKYGSIESYLQNECGLSTEACHTLRRCMVVPIPFEQKQFYRGISCNKT